MSDDIKDHLQENHSENDSIEPESSEASSDAPAVETAVEESSLETSAIDTEEDDLEKIRIIASDEDLAGAEQVAGDMPDSNLIEPPPEAEAEDVVTASREELKPAIEALLFVADEPLPFKQLSKVMGNVRDEDVKTAIDELVADYENRGSGLEIREIAGGWRISTRPQNHEFIRKYLKSRPSARLSLPALETLAVIAYKQPITIPEILEIRGVTSSSAIKTLLEKRLIVTKGRKETVGRPMLYGTSREFLIQFGMKDLTELPSIEDFEDLTQ